MANVVIATLADHPEFVPTLAQWLHSEWGHLVPGSSMATRIAKLRGEMNRDRLPVAVVAHHGTTLLGSASLRVHDMDTRPDLSPWLGGVFVAPQYRRQGIGAMLVDAILGKARDLRFGVVYLFTFDKEAYYHGLGWEVVERCEYFERPIVIMQKAVSAVHRPGKSPAGQRQRQ